MSSIFKFITHSVKNDCKLSKSAKYYKSLSTLCKKIFIEKEKWIQCRTSGTNIGLVIMDMMNFHKDNCHRYFIVSLKFRGYQITCRSSLAYFCIFSH